MTPRQLRRIPRLEINDAQLAAGIQASLEYPGLPEMAMEQPQTPDDVEQTPAVKPTRNAAAWTTAPHIEKARKAVADGFTAAFSETDYDWLEVTDDLDLVPSYTEFD